MRLGLIVYATLLAGLLPATAQAEMRAFVRPPEAVVAGRATTAWVYFCNDAAKRDTLTLPPTLVLRLAGDQGTVLVTARRDPEVKDHVALEAGAFCKAPYTFTWPPTLVGAVQMGWVEEPLAPARLLRPAEAPVAAVVAVAQPRENLPVSDRVVTTAPDTLQLGGIVPELVQQISTHEPLYILYGSKSPAIRWQLSFKYAIFQPNMSAPGHAPWWSGFYFGYTQTSLWNFTAPSSPFYDTSYRPELFYRRENWPLLRLPGVSRIDLQAGFQHESNGKDEEDSRSLNKVYIQPQFHVGQLAGWHLQIVPRVWAYLGDLSDNRDLDDYRGFGDLTLKVYQPDGLQVATLLRGGDSFEHVTLQVDLSYPVHRLLPVVSKAVYLQAQYFNGYGESLLDYRLRTDSLRLGISLWR